MKIAIIHDWLVTYSGAERVLAELIICYPGADVFTLIDVIPKEDRAFLQGKLIKTSWMQQIPFIRQCYRILLPIMPLTIEQFDLSNYNLIISSSHAVAKGVLIGPDQLHICLCYSPIRYAWDMQHQYLSDTKLDVGIKGCLARWLMHKIRMWDIRTANAVDHFIAISEYIKRRILKVYRRESIVIYPPVDVNEFEFTKIKEEFYITASRMVPYKKIPLIVKAFSKMPDKQLVVIGDGPDMNMVKSNAGNNIKVLGYQSSEVLKDYLKRAKAFIFAAEEDFGIAPLEAQACGTPVIAFGKGGALETIHGQNTTFPTGLFFYEQSINSITEAVALFENEMIFKILPQNCRKNAERFSPQLFQSQLKNFIENKWEEFQADMKK